VLTIRNAITCLLLATLALTACSKHSTPPTPTHPAPPPPPPPPSLTITSFSPTNGPDSTTVTITGTDFNSTAAEDSVYFNGKGARVVSATDSTLVAIVPELAGTGNVIVKANGSSVTGSTFTYDTSYHVSLVLDNLSGPFYLAIDTAGILYVSLYGNGTIEKINPSGSTTTLPGLPCIGLAIDVHNNLFAAIAAGGGVLLDKISATGDTTIIGGTSGFALGLAVDTSDNLYFCNVTENLVEKITPQGVLDTLASGLFSPSGVAVSGNGTIYVTNYSVNAYDNAAGALNAIGPLGNISTISPIDYDAYAGIFIDGINDVYVTVYDQGSELGWIEKVSPNGIPAILISPNLNFPCGIVRDKKGDFYVVQQVDAPGGTVGSIVKMTPY
jgi:hypothetical protein